MLKYFLFFLFLFPPLGSYSYHQNIDKIPLEDQQKLERFFDYLMHNSVIGYSLCGDKPVSIETFPTLSKIPSQYALKIFSGHPGYSILWQGLEAWTRYDHHFPSKNYALRFIKKSNTLVIINKKSTKKTIEENIDLFIKYSNSDKTAVEFLEEICSPKEVEYIKHNNILLGILLGYGRNNAIAFSMKSYVQKLDGFRLYDNSNDSLNAFINPGFIIINNGTNEEENNRVRQSFQAAKISIQSRFKKGTYLVNFIELLTR